MLVLGALGMLPGKKKSGVTNSVCWGSPTPLALPLLMAVRFACRKIPSGPRPGTSSCGGERRREGSYYECGRRS